MVASVMFGLAEIELDYRRERQAAGIKVAQQAGIYQGRKKGSTKAAPARARALQSQGLTASEIARVMAVSPRTVFRYLAVQPD
jgi:DNA invertase Pin-like site-specific DNA recombinase